MFVSRPHYLTLHFTKFNLKVLSLPTWQTFIKWKILATFWTVNLRNHWTPHSLPMLLTLTLLTLIFSHFRSNEKKAKKFGYTYWDSLWNRWCIHLIKGMELASFSEMLAQVLPRYSIWHQSRHIYVRHLEMYSHWGWNGTPFGDYLIFPLGKN